MPLQRVVDRGGDGLRAFREAARLALDALRDAVRDLRADAAVAFEALLDRAVQALRLLQQRLPDHGLVRRGGGVGLEHSRAHRSRAAGGRGVDRVRALGEPERVAIKAFGDALQQVGAEQTMLFQAVADGFVETLRLFEQAMPGSSPRAKRWRR